MARSLLLVLCMLSACTFASTYTLKKHSDIKNPLGLWVIPSGSNQAYSKIAIVVSKKVNTSVYITYNYRISDVMSSFSDFEYLAHNQKSMFEIRKHQKTVAIVEADTKEREINGIKLMTSCAIYDKDSNKTRAILWAYCPLAEGNELVVRSPNGGKIATLKKDKNWQLSIDKKYESTLGPAVFLLSGLMVFYSA